MHYKCDLGVESHPKTVSRYLHIESRENRVCTAIRLRAERCGVQIPAGANFFLYFKTLRPTLCPPSLPFNVYKALSWEKGRRDVQFATQLHLMPRLRIIGTIPLLVYTFMTRRIALAKYMHTAETAVITIINLGISRSKFRNLCVRAIDSLIDGGFPAVHLQGVSR